MTPAVVGERIYVGSCAGGFFAIDAATGTALWSYDTSREGRPPAQFHGEFLVTDDLVLAGADAHVVGYLYAFQRMSGEPLWKLSFPKGVAADVLRWDGHAFIASEVGDVAAVDLATGTSIWQVKAPREGAREPRPLDLVLTGDRLVVAWRSGPVVAYDAETGRRLWLRDLGSTLNASPVVVGQDVVVGTIDGRIHRLRSNDGEIVGGYELGGALYGDLVTAPGCVLALSARGGFHAEEGMVGPHAISCIDRELGSERWRHQLAEAWGTFHPLVHGATVVVGIEGKLLALSLDSGAPLWERSIEGLPRGLASSDDLLYVGTRAGLVLALSWRR